MLLSEKRDVPFSGRCSFLCAALLLLPNLRPSKLQNPTYDPRSAPPPRNAERTPIEFDPAIDSGLKAVSLLDRHSLLAHHTAPAASFEGSILLCNDYRHASPPARSESWGVVDVQVDFTGLAAVGWSIPWKYLNL